MKGEPSSRGYAAHPTAPRERDPCATLRFDGNGELVGLTLVRPKQLLEREGGLRITVPVPSAVPAAELTPVLTA